MKQPEARPLPPAQHRYVLAALFLTGAATLTLEIVGTRVISPYYGSSLYCWSALITVTLVALAAGYSFGGRQADKVPSLTLFARLACLAGAATALIPVLREPVLKMTSPLGIQLGALASATVLIAPPLVLLSALGPLAIRLTAQAVASVGRSAGDVYAVSTLGSVLGAALAGFVLIPHLAISRILYGMACLLLLIGAFGYYLSRRVLPLPQLAASAAVALLGFWPKAAVETNVLVNRNSAYGQIKVLDFDGMRYLLVDGTTQSMAEIATLETQSQYARSFEWAALLRPEARRALVIGVGAGLLPVALERHYGLTADAVDVDGEIIATARSHFGFSTKGGVFLEDGRTFLERASDRYDLLFLDAFSAESPPYHLFTRESFQAMSRRLSPDGILAVNLVTLLEGPGASAWKSAYKTLSSVFPEVRAFVASDVSDGMANVVFFCSRAPLSGPARPARPAVRDDIRSMQARELAPAADELRAALLMSDDRAPMEFLLARTSLRWRAALQERVPEILLY